MQNHRECHFLSVLTDRVHQPLATVRVVPLYQMCGRVAYLHVAFLPHIAKVCEKFMNFEWIFCTNPVCVCVHVGVGVHVHMSECMFVFY